MEPIAQFEKVSLDEYLRSRVKTPKGSVSDEVYKKILDRAAEEWDRVVLPERSTSGSAGYDFYSPADYHIYSNDSTLARFNDVICTGIRCRIAEGHFLMLLPRSGLGFKYGLRLKNTSGIIDSDYYHADNEGHIMAKLVTDVDDVSIKAGDRFMQGIFVPYGIAVNDSNKILDKRLGGFGSTGI